MNTQEILKQIEKRIAELSKPGEVAVDRANPLAGNPAITEIPQPKACDRPATETAAPLPPVAPIAIIGLSGYLPKCQSVRDFWQALDNDESLLEEIPKTRFDWEKHYDPSGAQAMKSYTKWGGFIPQISGFDAGFFQMLPKDAKLLDPRQRLLLMSVYHTLEDAGYAPESLRKTHTGVFVGAEENEYVKPPQWDITQSQGIGNAPSMIANQISYFFDWRGPSEYLNAMCSGGAVAIHRAVASLRAGESSQAIVGTANLLLRPETFIALSAMGQMSRTEAVNSFGPDANGYLPAEGVASILLKPLAQAEADGDAIYAVLKNTAVNFNGQGGMSIAAPNVASHTDLILQCYREAGLNPCELGYIEAQGMANPITDIAEWRAFNRALQILAQESGVVLSDGGCKVSTLKPTSGHMQSASAFGALFKILRSFQTDTIYRIRGFRQANPDLETERQPCRLAASNQHWPPQSWPRLAGLHSYGSGGSNAHLLIEEYRPQPMPAPVCEKPEILVFSAQTPTQCRTQIAHLLAALRQNPAYPLASVAHTLRVGRDAMEARVAFIAQTRDEWIRQAEAYLDGQPVPRGVFAGESGKDSPCPLPAAADGDLHAFAQDWAKGRCVAWPPTSTGKAVRLHLPTYPFELKEYWLDKAQAAPPAVQRASLSDPAGMFPVHGPCQEESHQETNFISENLTMNANPDTSRSAGEKAVELFTYCAATSDQDFYEDYLTFCPFPERTPGFSMTRVFLNPKQYRKEMALIQRKQIEMRQVLFFKEDFTQIRHLLDIGCGHGTDVIQIAHYYPHICTDGFTITKAQADLGSHRIAQKGLSDRARIFNHDSSKVAFPRQDYDVVIGLEVSCLVADKDGLFKNIESSLKNHGRVLLMDFIANLHGAIEDPSIDIYIPTQEQWARNLAKHHLVLDELIDVSPQIANFQHDPEHEENLKDCPQVVRDSWRNYANNAVAIDRGWLSYMLFRLREDQYSDVAELEKYNMGKLRTPKPYPLALQEMLAVGHVPYPILDESLLADAYPDERRRPQPSENIENPSDFARLKDKLAELFETTLSLPKAALDRAETFKHLGITSINSVDLLQAINGEFELKLPTSLIFEHNTLDALTGYLEIYLGKHHPQQLDKLRNSAAPSSIQQPTTGMSMPPNPLKTKLLELFSNTLGIQSGNFPTSGKFNALGISSIHSVELMQAINTEFRLTLPTSVIFECNSVDALADHLKALGITVAGDAQKKNPARPQLTG